jgi:predicted ArsR family transcriptional regulator
VVAKVNPSTEDKGTRSTLLAILKRAGSGEVSQLASELEISGVAVRRHLAVLEKDGHVHYQTVRRARGRPVRIYRLTAAAETAFPNSSEEVALDLLQRIENVAGSKAVEAAVQSRMDDLKDQYTAQLRGIRSLTKKMEKLAEIRDAEGNYCSLELVSTDRAKGGVRLVARHCPIASVAIQHPQMCQKELDLFRTVLGEPGLARVEHLRSGAPACAYEVPRKKR